MIISAGMISGDDQYKARSFFADAGRLAVHTLLVYVCALHLSGWLVSRWFILIAPLLQISSNARPEDWYLQHLELVTLVPALVVGYFNVFRFAPAMLGGPKDGIFSSSTARWAFVVPTGILCYELLTYRTPKSILYDRSLYDRFMQAVRYFFSILPEAPKIWNLSASDPVRVLAQMTVTAPFYAGIAYSAGALASKYDLLTKLSSLWPSRLAESDFSSSDE
jgi:hypothetical protein